MVQRALDEVINECVDRTCVAPVGRAVDEPVEPHQSAATRAPCLAFVECGSEVDLVCSRSGGFVLIELCVLGEIPDLAVH